MSSSVSEFCFGSEPDISPEVYSLVRELGIIIESISYSMEWLQMTNAFIYIKYSYHLKELIALK